MNIDSNITNLEILKNTEQLSTTYNSSLKKKFLELKGKLPWFQRKVIRDIFKSSTSSKKR